MTEKRGTAQSVTVEYLQQQRAAGWPEVHPEDYCHKCGNRNVSWWVDSDVWNAVMDSATSPYHGIICPSCFGERFEERYPDTGWELRLSEDTRGARTFRTENPARAEALTPTDDERAEWTASLEALLAEVYSILKPLAEGNSHGSSSPILKAYALLNAQDLRRSEVPEPSAEATHRGTFGHVWPCPLFYVGNWKRGDEEYYPEKECSNAGVCEAEPQGEPSGHRDRIALAEFIDKALDGDAGYGVGEFLAGGILSFLSERTALHAAFEPQGEPSDAHLSNVSIDGVQQSWKQLYEREHEQHLALQGYRRMLSDLDRNASGRHEGDYDSHATGNGGISAGNPHLTTGQIIGYDIGGREYVVPEPRDRGTLSAWVRAAGEAGGEGR